MAGFMMSGKTEEETMAFLKEADEAKIARKFAKYNRLYGVRFLLYFYDKWVFSITSEPGILIDPAYPPTYIIIEEDMTVRFSTPEEEAEEIFEIRHI